MAVQRGAVRGGVAAVRPLMEVGARTRVGWGKRRSDVRVRAQSLASGMLPGFRVV